MFGYNPVIVFGYNRHKKKFVIDDYKEELTNNAISKKEIELSLNQIENTIKTFSFRNLWTKWFFLYLAIVTATLITLIVLAIKLGTKSFPYVFGICFGILILSTIFIWFYSMRHNFTRSTYQVLIKKHVVKTLHGINTHYMLKGYILFLPPNFPNSIELWKSTFEEEAQIRRSVEINPPHDHNIGKEEIEKNLKSWIQEKLHIISKNIRALEEYNDRDL